jgi:hypothetical protein
MNAATGASAMVLARKSRRLVLPSFEDTGEFLPVQMRAHLLPVASGTRAPLSAIAYYRAN